jgi:hypothetical protein
MATGSPILTATVGDVLNIARSKIGLGESPPGSHHNEITQWYGIDGPWCAMFVSWTLAHAGFSKDGGATLSVPGVVETTDHGWAYVPYLLNNFRDAGRTTMTPAAGLIVTFVWGSDTVPDHTGIVESVYPDGTFDSIEGNHNHEVERVHRTMAVVDAFCTLPYDGEANPSQTRPSSPAGIPPFPGYCSIGSKDAATRDVQQRLKDRGWSITVDGVFGPETLRVVKAFQTAKNLTVDGVVGPQTWNALWSS